MAKGIALHSASESTGEVQGPSEDICAPRASRTGALTGVAMLAASPPKGACSLGAATPGQAGLMPQVPSLPFSPIQTRLRHLHPFFTHPPHFSPV